VVTFGNESFCESLGRCLAEFLFLVASAWIRKTRRRHCVGAERGFISSVEDIFDVSQIGNERGWLQVADLVRFA